MEVARGGRCVLAERCRDVGESFGELLEAGWGRCLRATEEEKGVLGWKSDEGRC